ncbi:MAG: NADH:ubiquinone reductase (Na(+)-transporting) subunit B [Proteobacteria bacterium]|nr:NADH:ubiquinone reductase (Na(+)-transporting) subunit B [Pseudomonadota bacterium]MBU1057067.1 NADH:ubiquinone reductase (Na(+)-transporting) subunit B [Pseudomonadota bacterium]
MKALSKILEDAGRFFAKGGRFARYYSLYEAVDSFLFGSNQKTQTAPHVRDSIDLKRIMSTVIIALMPCVLMALWNTGYQANSAIQVLGLSGPDGWRGTLLSFVGCDPENMLANFVHGALYFLPVYLVTLVVGSFWEGLFTLIRGHEFSEAFLVTSLLFALILPPTIPLWQVAIGISFGVIFAKEVFGGVGRNFMNPALVSRAFIFFAYPAQMSGDQVWTAVDGITGATALSQFAGARPGEIMDSVSITWLQSFLGTVPGSMGETSTLACLFGAFILLITGIASWRIMLSMLLGGLICSGFFWLQGSAVHPMYNIPPHWHLVLGGFAFGLVFMATDPVSAAHTATGQWLFGLLVGGLAILIRVANPAYSEGVMLAILLGNVFAPLFDYFVIQANIKRRKLRHG